MMRKALIAVSFGTSYPETRKKTIEAVEQKLAESFPDHDVVRAFTSNKVIKKIQEQEGLEILTVDQQMRRLAEAGYQEVILQPLHIINGSEYSKALHQAMKYSDRFNSVKVGAPLLTSIEDYRGVIAWLEGLATGLAEDEAIVLMGHGSQHAAFTVYACLDHMVMKEPIFVCAVESYPEIDTVVDRLKEAGYRRIKLYPLMLVAGDHATNDMASDEEDSWKSQLQQAGFEVEPVLQGMGEFPQIQEQFVAHAAAVMEG